MDTDVPFVTSPTPHTFPRIPESTKIRVLYLHNLVSMAQTLVSNMDHDIKVHANLEGHSAAIEEEQL